MRTVKNVRPLSPLRSRLLALFAVVAVALTGAVVAPTAALAATGTVSSVTVTIQYDGTAPFPGPATLGQDSGANNGVVRNGDLVGYTFDTQVSAPGDITFQTTLPVGMVWDPSATINTIFTGPNDTMAGGAISNGGRTLTGVRTSPGGNESFSLSARVVGMGDGDTVAPSFTYGGVTAAAPVVSVTAKPRTDLALKEVLALPYDNAGVTGAKQSFTGFLGIYKSTNPHGTGIDMRGFAPLIEPITFTLNVPAGTSVIEQGPGVVASQPGGPGTPVTFSITGKNTSTSGTSSNPYFADFQTMSSFTFALFTPKTPFIPDGAVTNLDYRMTAYDPLGKGGQSNFGTGYSRGMDPAVDCTGAPQPSTVFSGCGRQIVDLTVKPQAPALSADPTSVTAPDGSNIFGSGTPAVTGRQVILPGQGFTVSDVVRNGTGPNVTAASNQYGCTVWDNTLMNISGVPQISNAVVQYTTQPFANDTARKAVDCGVAGDGSALWYDDLASVPGGMAAVTGTRYVLTQDLQPGALAVFRVPMVRPTTTTAIASTARMNWFFQWGADGQPLVKSKYTPGVWQQRDGGFVRPSNAIVDGKIVSDTATTTPGTVTVARFTPSLIGSPVAGVDNVATNVAVVVDFSHSTVNPVKASLDALVDSGQVQSYDLVMPDAGADGIFGTPDDVGTATVTFHLGDVMAYGGPADDGYNNLTGHRTVLPDLAFQVQNSVLTPNPRTHVLTATISSDTAQPILPGTTSKANIAVAGVASFVTGKTASTAVAGKVSPGETFTYTINWANATSQATGVGTFVDVLPYNGDSRGTSGLSAGPLQVKAVSASTDTAVQGLVTIQYTTDAAAAVAAAVKVAGNEDAHTGVTWTTGAPPANATALRFITEKELFTGYSGSATIQVTVPSLSKGGALKNDVYGSTAAFNGDPATRKTVIAAGAVNLASNSANVAGTIRRDLDFDGQPTAPDAAWPAGATVEFLPVGNGLRYTAPVGAGGTYALEIAAGEYRVQLVSPAGWAKVLPTADLTLAVGDDRSGFDLLYQEEVAPAALVDDTALTTAGTAISVNVTSNDTLAFPQAPGSVYTRDGVGIGAAPAHGTAVLAAPTAPSTQSTIVYTAAAAWPAEFAGQTTYVDTFTYRWTNAQGEESTATVTVTVVAPMTGTDQSATIPVGGAATLDAGVTGEGVSAGPLSGIPTGAAASVTASGVLSFDAGTAAPGTYPMTVVFTDVAGNSKTVTYTVTVQAAPTADDAELTVRLAGSGTADAEVAGTDVTAGPVVGTPVGATATVTDAGELSFDAGSAAAGTYPLTVTFTDSVGQTVTATYTVRIQALPTATGGTATIAVAGSHAFDAAPLADPAVPSASIVAGAITTAPGGGASATADASGAVTFSAGTAVPGTYTFTARFTDDLGQTVDAVYTVTVQAAPTATGGTATIAVNGSHTFSAAPTTSGTIVSAQVTQPPTAGTVTAGTDGAVVFDGSGAPAGTYPFEVTFTDDLGQTVVARYTVTVQAAPTATGGTATIAEDGSHTFHASPKADPAVSTASIASATVSAPPSAGGVSVDTAGAVVFDGTGVAPGTYPFEVTFTDDLGQTVVAHYAVTITPPPTADGSTSAVIAMDADADFAITLGGTTVTESALTSAPSAGTVAHDPSGDVSFDAEGIPAGTYTFDVTFSDDLDQSTTVSFTVTVQAKPTATAGSATVPMDGTHSFTAAPKADPAVASATITDGEISAQPAEGSATATTAGVVTFDADGAAAGTYSFEATFTDDLGQTVTTTYTVVVQAKPTATGGDVVIPTNGSHTFDAAPKADPAVGSAAITAAGVTVLPAAGTAAAATDGTVHYDGAGAAPGEYTFTVQFTDDLGQTVTASFAVTVQAPPTAVGGTATIPENGSKTFDAAPKADPVVPGASIASAAVSLAPSAGVATVDAATGDVRFDAAGVSAGTYTFEVTFTDDLGQTVTTTYTVTVQGKTSATGSTDAVIAVGGDADFALSFDGAVTSATVTTPPSAGNATASTDGTVAFDGTGAAPGVYTFVVTFEDDLGQPTPVTFTVTVQAPPTASGGSATIGEASSHIFAANPKADPAVSTASIATGAISSPPAQGSATADAAGTVTFTGGSAAPGTYTFDATFTDDLGQTVTTTYTVTVQAKPVSAGQVPPLVVKLGGSGTLDAQVSGTGMTAGAPGGVPAGATATATPDGVLSFDAGTAAAGTYPIVVTFTDSTGQQVTVTYTVTVQAAPTATSGSATIATGGSHTFDAAPQADPNVAEAKIVDATVGQQPAAGSVTVTTDGEVVFDGAGEAPGTYAFEVVFTDDLGQTVTTPFMVTVQAAPTANGGSAVVGLGGTHVFDAAPAADPSVGSAAITGAAITQAPSGGATATADTSGAVSFDAGAAPAGTYTFEATFTDDLGQTVAVSYTVVVQGTPVVTGGTSALIGEDETATIELDVATTGTVTSAAVTSPPSAGNATVSPDGTVEFDATGADPGTYTFDVMFTDDLGQTTTATITVTVRARPAVEDQEVSILTNGSYTFTEKVTTDGTYTAEITAGPAQGTVRLGPLVYEAGATPGTYVFEVTYTDDVGQTVVATYTVHVAAPPATPGNPGNSGKGGLPATGGTVPVLLIGGASAVLVLGILFLIVAARRRRRNVEDAD